MVHTEKFNREELRAKLKQKIDNKRNNRVNSGGLNRSKTIKINDDLKKLYNIVEKHISEETLKSGELPQELITEISDTISKTNLEDLINYLNKNEDKINNNKFTELLEKINELIEDN